MPYNVVAIKPEAVRLMTVDGKLVPDRVVVGHLRMPLEAMRVLKEMKTAAVSLAEHFARIDALDGPATAPSERKLTAPKGAVVAAFANGRRAQRNAAA